MTARRGRPPGLLLNPDAFAALLAGRSQAAIAKGSGVSTAHLSEMLSGGKAATRKVADDIADTLGVKVGAIFPELAQLGTKATRRFAAPPINEAAA